MSYLCDGVDDRLVGALAAARAGQPTSIMAWIKGVANTGAGRVVAALATTDGVLDNSEYINLTTAGFVQANTRTTSNANAQTAVAMPDQAWCCCLAVFATSSDRRIYLDGANKVVNTTARNIASGIDTIILGSRSDSTAFFPGRVAELAIWDVALSDADAAALAAGDSPMSLATPPLRYYRLKADALDIDGANGLAVTGATLDADHPAVDDPPGGAPAGSAAVADTAGAGELVAGQRASSSSTADTAAAGEAAGAARGALAAVADTAAAGETVVGSAAQPGPSAAVSDTAGAGETVGIFAGAIPPYPGHRDDAAPAGHFTGGPGGHRTADRPGHRAY